MDDKPTIEYHPFGTITLNFDDVTVKLRRCRLGDLQYAKDLLAELQESNKELRESWIDQVSDARIGLPDAELPEAERVAFFAALTEAERTALAGKVTQLNKLNETMKDANRGFVYTWLSQVAQRMGDNPIPPKEEWPLDLLEVSVLDVLDHWQSRPLASGRTSPNGTMREAATSLPSPPDPSYPPAPL